MPTNRITPLTESGLLAALTVIMGLASVYVPVLGMVAAVLWPMPVIVLVVRHGLRWGVMASLVAGVLMALLIEPTISLRMVITFAPMSLALGYGFYKNWSAVRILLVSFVVSIASVLVGLGLVLLITGINPMDMQMDMMKESMDASISLYKSAGLTDEQLQESVAQMNQAVETIKLLFPLIIIVSGVVVSFMNYWIAARVLKRLGHIVPMLPPFSEWRLPKVVIYLYGFALIGMYWGSSREIAALYQISLNLNMLATFMGLLQGLAVIFFFINRRTTSTVLKVLVVCIILMNGFFTQVLSFVGIFDMLFDYRRRFGGQNEVK